jgi:hypothetical protein
VDEVTVSTTYDVEDVPDRINVRVLAGRPFELTIPIRYANGVPVPAVNMSGARAHIRAAIDDPQVYHVFSTADEEPDAEITDDGVILTAPPAVTSLWAEQWPGRAPETTMWWDLEVTDVDGTPRQVNTPGTFIVVHEVTR